MKEIPEPIQHVLRQKLSATVRAEQIFLSHAPTAFAENLQAWTDVRKRVAETLGVAIHQVLVCGSAMVGYSFVNNRPFQKGSSDLDIAVISANLFVRCLEEANKVTRAYRDNTRFPRRDDINVLDFFLETAAKRGMIRFDLMPKCIMKTEIDTRPC